MVSPVSAHLTGKVFTDFSHFKCLPEQHTARELQVDRTWTRLYLQFCTNENRNSTCAKLYVKKIKSLVSDFRTQRSSELQYKIRLEVRTEALTDKIISKGKIDPRTDYEGPEVE